MTIRHYPDGSIIPPTNVLIREIDFGWGVVTAVRDCWDQLWSIAVEIWGIHF